MKPLDVSTERHFDWADNLHSIYYRTKSYLKRFWWVLIITLSLSIAYQAYKEMNREPIFISSAKMIVTGSVNILDKDVYKERLKNFYGTEVVRMTSGEIQNRARNRVKIERPELQALPVTVNAYHKNGTNIFVLSATGGEALYTQVYLEAILQEYQDDRKMERSQSAKVGMAALELKLAGLKQEMEIVEDKILDFKRNNNLVFTQEQVASSGSYLSQLKKQMADLKLQQKFISSQTPEDRLQESAGVNSGSGANSNTDNYNETKAKLDLLLAEREEFSLYLKNKHPKMMRFDREISRMQERLGILKRQALGYLDKERNNLGTSIGNLQEAINEAEETALVYSQKLAEYDQLVKQQTRASKLYEEYMSKIKEIDFGIDVSQETIRIYEHASAAYQIRNDFRQSIIAGSIMGLIFGGAIIFLLGNLDRRVVSTEDLKNNFDDPILGIIPKEKSFSKNNLGFLQDKDSRHIFAEAFRTLRSSILFMDQAQSDKKPNTYIITSAVPEEGKSTIASNLAISLAYASSRTLLVDADLRRGRLNRLFGVPNKNGLIEVLDERMALDDAIINTEIENLDFIPRGESIAKTGELLLSNRMIEAIDAMKNAYDYVIFDAAPVLATDDTTSFASKVDSILYVVRSSTIRVRQVRVALDSLKMRGANILGFIVNFADTRGMDYYYYNKYQYYYRYQSNE